MSGMDSKLESVSAASTLPEGFNPMMVSNTDLVKHGYPPRPDKNIFPRLRALWERTFSRPLTFITAPEFSTGEIPPSSPPRTTMSIQRNISNTFQSGAYLPNPIAGEKFYTITAAWTVPNVYPPKGSGDGTWQCWNWIGLDGFGTSGGALMAGTWSKVVVTGGKVNKQFWAWYCWDLSNGGAPIYFFNVPVTAGDTVQVLLCGPNYQGPNASAMFDNFSTGGTTPLVSIPPPSATAAAEYQGQTAAWIVESPQYPGSNLPDYGATLFYNTICGCKDAAGNGNELDLSGATYINMVQGNNNVSTAVQEPASEVLQVYAYSNAESPIP